MPFMSSHSNNNNSSQHLRSLRLYSPAETSPVGDRIPTGMEETKAGSDQLRLGVSRAVIRSLQQTLSLAAQEREPVDKMLLPPLRSPVLLD